MSTMARMTRRVDLVAVYVKLADAAVDAALELSFDERASMRIAVPALPFGRPTAHVARLAVRTQERDEALGKLRISLSVPSFGVLDNTARRMPAWSSSATAFDGG